LCNFGVIAKPEVLALGPVCNFPGVSLMDFLHLDALLASMDGEQIS
jgi:hypothetical protein